MNTHFDPELSRLAFEDRLIEFCEDQSIPLLERVRMLGIIAGRLDVFFMTRIGRLKRLVDSGDETRKNSGMSPSEQLAAVCAEAARISHRSYELLHDDLLPGLAQHQVTIERLDGLSRDDQERVRAGLRDQIRKFVNPLLVESTQGFPHVRNLRPALVAQARSNGAPTSFVVVELPAELPRLVPVAGNRRFVPLEEVLAAELPALCAGVSIGEPHLFRVTRNADTDYDGEHDVLGNVEEEVVRRPFQEVVRLEVDSAMPAALRDQLLGAFECETDTPEASLGDRDLYAVPGLVDLTGLDELASLDVPELKCAPTPRRRTRVDARVLDRSSEGQLTERLLHFPFDDYEASLEEILARAVSHPDLESIQTTIYRTDRDSGVVAALRAARARGADASAVVELKASFDEQDNIRLARSLEADGVRVVLSPLSLKVHAKIAVVTLRSGKERRHVALIGTGNMNAVTARSYLDLWLVTANSASAREVAGLFDLLCGRSKEMDFDALLVAPFHMRQRFLELIERETAHATAGRAPGIRVMINGLTDPAIIAALYRASKARVPIEMLVRGVCLLRPGAPEMSENIRVVSVGGRLLQHARIFHFRNAGSDEYFIGSADWRPRNLDTRVEVVTRVQEPEHHAYLDRVLTETLTTPDGWELGPDGVYVRRGRAGCEPASQGSRTYVTLTPS